MLFSLRPTPFPSGSLVLVAFDSRVADRGKDAGVAAIGDQEEILRFQNKKSS
jgi:hypothetical protein